MEAETVPVKLTEIETVMLNTQVVSPFCISWSEDNKILIVAEGGAFIYELWPTPQSDQATVTFKKSWIPASTITPLTDAVVDDKNGFFIWSMDRKDAFETVLDSTLSFVAHKPNISFTTPHIIQCKFSPLINNRSYISCLTNYGLLGIYKSKSSKYVPAINVSNLWLSYSNLMKHSSQVDFNYFKSKMYELKVTTTGWYKNQDVVFVTGHESGIIVLWNAYICNDELELSVRHFIPINEKPLCLQLSPTSDPKLGHLFIGASSGIIKYFLLNLENGEINQNFYLWENKDFITPSFIKVVIINEKTFVLTVKRHILLIQCLGVNSENEYVVEDTSWQEFSSEITSINEYFDKFVISLQNHDVFEVDIKDTKSVDICEVETGLKPKHKISHHCYGLTMSRNKAIWMMISAPKVNYDNLKEISHLIILSPEIKQFKSVIDTSPTLLIEQVLTGFHDTSLSDIYDLLILKKFELLADNTKFRETFELNENLSLIDLQLMLWEVKLKIFCNFPEEDTVVNDIELLIVRDLAQKVLVKLGSQKTMSEMESRSLFVCQAFLMKETAIGKSSCEICAICGEDTFFENIRISSCVNLHRFPRCCLSLLACSVCPYAICRMCDSVALIDFVTESNNRCPYCDGLLEPDTRVQAPYH